MSDPTEPFQSASRSVIRERRDDDLASCVSLLADVHATSGYPVDWPSDPRMWLSPKTLLGAWVTDGEQSVIGHVALLRVRDDAEGQIWSAASGLVPEQLAEVARLFVAPRVRGRGLGAALLSRACAEAAAKRLHPALAVLDRDREAITLYQRTGWRHIETKPASWIASEGPVPQIHYYLGPI